MGDIMDRRKYISYRIAKDVRERFIQPFVDLGVELHVMVGNHDTYFKNTNEVNSVTELVGDRYNNVYIYPEATEVTFDNLPILFIPWINASNHAQTLQTMEQTKAPVAMGHLEVQGFEMIRGVKNEHGYDKNLFRKFDTVFSGHFHVKSDDGHIYYLGSPYELYWNDCDDRKGFHVFDTETRELERILNSRTIHKKIYYNDTDTDYKQHDITQYKDNYVKVIVVNKKDLYQFENTQDTMTLLSMYIDELDTSLSKGRLKNIQRELYTEAQDLQI